MNSTQNNRDLITFSVLWIVSIILYFVLIPQQVVLRGFSWSGDIAFNSQTFPKMLAVCLFVVSFLGIVKCLKNRIKMEKDPAINGKDASGRQKETLYVKMFPAIIFMTCIAYVFLFANAGFIIATIIVMPVMLALFKCKKWQYYISVYAFATILYIVFRIMLRVPLP